MVGVKEYGPRLAQRPQRPRTARVAPKAPPQLLDRLALRTRRVCKRRRKRATRRVCQGAKMSQPGGREAGEGTTAKCGEAGAAQQCSRQCRYLRPLRPISGIASQTLLTSLKRQHGGGGDGGNAHDTRHEAVAGVHLQQGKLSKL